MTNMFSEITQRELGNKTKDKEEEFEETMNKRGAGLFKQMSTIEELKENIYSVEHTKAKNNIENEIDFKRRQKKKIPINYGKSLFDNLRIDKAIYDKSKEINVTFNDLDSLIVNLSSNNINDQYLALVGIRKLLCLPQFPVNIIIDK